MTAVSTPARAPHLTFGRLLRSELRKLTTLRSTWITGGIAVVLYGLLVAVGAFTISDFDISDGASSIVNSMLITAYFQLLVLFAISMGALAVTGEYSHRTIQTSVLAEPRRLPFFLAKILAFTFVWLVISIVTIVVSIVVAQIGVSSVDASLPLGDVDFWLTMASWIVTLLVGAYFAMALGYILRSTAGAITASIGLVLVLPIVQAIPWDFFDDIGPYLPLNLMGSAIAPRESGANLMFLGIGDDSVGANASLLWLVVYAVILLVLAAVSLKRRDT